MSGSSRLRPPPPFGFRVTSARCHPLTLDGSYLLCLHALSSFQRTGSPLFRGTLRGYRRLPTVSSSKSPPNVLFLQSVSQTDSELRPNTGRHRHHDELAFVRRTLQAYVSSGASVKAFEPLPRFLPQKNCSKSFWSNLSADLSGARSRRSVILW
jgi:hypothetical protein